MMQVPEPIATCWVLRWFSLTAGSTNVFQALFITGSMGGLGPLQMNTASLNFSCECWV
jgi:hypothetical protein